MNKEFTCIICPRGCHLVVDENDNVSGNFCPRGKIYALNEIKNPVRVVTSTIKVSNRENIMASVKTNIPISKKMIFEVMNVINQLTIAAPVKVGDIVVKNILNTGADLIITKNIY